MNITDEEGLLFSVDYDGDFWMLCAGDGLVSMCSRAASDFGLIPGSTNASCAIQGSDIPEFEDALRLAGTGADVSVLLEAAPETGYSVAHLKSKRLFSMSVLEVCLYRNKNEYLASTSGKSERISRVFEYMSRSISQISVRLREAALIEAPDAVRNSIVRAANQMERLSLDEAFIAEHCSGDESSAIFDASALFDLISEKFTTNSGNPFNAKFVNDTPKGAFMCCTDSGSFVGIVLMSAAVASRLSSDKRCRVILSSDGDSLVIEAMCRMRKGISLCARSCDFGRLYKLLSASPAELMILEYLTSAPGWETNFESNADGGFVLRASLDLNADPDRLKYRDGLAGASDTIDGYLSYLNKAFSSDA